MMMSNFQEKVRDIISNAEKYHSEFYQAEIFSGPSLYFHKRALQSCNSNSFKLYLEYIYATLASWGMHRMGKGGSKMQPFDVFEKSVQKIKDKIEEAKTIDYQDISEQSWEILKSIFSSINVMASGTSLVGNSKVMAHLIPNVIPPIDREYTLKYLIGNTNINNDIEQEWILMKEIVSEFFIPVVKDESFIKKANEWMTKQEEFPWDTSVYKIIDNLVIGAGKILKKNKRKA